MARYINGRWVVSCPLPREPYYKVGEKVIINGNEVVITEIHPCQSVSGPVGCLLLKDEVLPDKYFNFIYYFCYFERSIGGQNYFIDERYYDESKSTYTGYRQYELKKCFDDEIPYNWKKHRKKRKPFVDPDWEYNDEKFEETQHHAIYIRKPDKFQVTRKEFHSFSYYGIASFLINYPVSFEEFKGGIKIYLADRVLYEVFQNWRFKDLECRRYESVEFGFIKVPRDHFLFNIIKSKFHNYFLS